MVTENIMVSDFFYLQSMYAAEEKRIAYTQSRIADVRAFLDEIVFRTTFRPSIPATERDPFFAQFGEFPEEPWKAAWNAAPDNNRAVIDRNWWIKKTEEFCATHHCKIPDIDFLYILMQMFREKGIDVRPADCSLTFAYSKPNYLFEAFYD